MDIQKEREAFEKLPAVAELIKTNNVWWSEVHGDYFGSDHELDCWIDGAWAVWQAKSQAVPEGFLLVSSKELLDLTVAINAVDLATHTDNKTNEVRKMWQDIAIKLSKLGEDQEQSHE